MVLVRYVLTKKKFFLSKKLVKFLYLSNLKAMVFVKISKKYSNLIT